MNDDEFREVELKSLCPNADEWSREYMHQKALIAAANEVRAFVREAYTRLDQIDANRDLTPEAKKRQRAKLASEFVGQLEASKALTRAREAVADVLQKYEAKINSNLEPAADPQSVGVHAQIRSQLAAIKDPKDRVSFFGRNGSDLSLISAVLSAPAFVSGLTEAEAALLRKNLERHAPPEIIKERDFVHTALAEVERGFRAAKDRIVKRGGLDKLPDGSWGQAAAHQNAAA